MYCKMTRNADVERRKTVRMQDHQCREGTDMSDH